MEHIAEYLKSLQSYDRRDSSDSSQASVNIMNSSSELLNLLNMPWDRIQQLMRESDSLLQSGNDTTNNLYLNDCQTCQPKIQELENKLLEIQQQLSVAVTSNYTKNMMIDQLDKTLSKVVDRWKKFEVEKTNQILESERDRIAMETLRKKEQEILNKLECELNETLKKLMLSQEEVKFAHEEKQQWIEKNASELNQLHYDLELKNETLEKLTCQHETLMRDHLTALENLQSELEQERAKNRQWEIECSQLKETVKKQMYEEMKKHGEEWQQLQREHEKLRDHLGSVIQEKDSLKDQVNILESYKANAEEEKNVALDKQKQEYEKALEITKQQLHLQYKEMLEFVKRLQQSSFEKIIKDKEEWALKEIEAVEKKCKDLLKEMDDDYKKQLMEKQTTAEKEQEELKEKLQEFEHISWCLQEESSSLANIRSSMMSRIQSLLQSQWHEVLHILYGKNGFPNKEMSNLNFTHNHSISHSLQCSCNCTKRSMLDYIPCSDKKLQEANEKIYLNSFLSEMTKNQSEGVSCDNHMCVSSFTKDSCADLTNTALISKHEKTPFSAKEMKNCSQASKNQDEEISLRNSKSRQMPDNILQTNLMSKAPSCENEFCNEKTTSALLCNDILSNKSNNFDEWLNSLTNKSVHDRILSSVQHSSATQSQLESLPTKQVSLNDRTGVSEKNDTSKSDDQIPVFYFPLLSLKNDTRKDSSNSVFEKLENNLNSYSENSNSNNSELLKKKISVNHRTCSPLSSVTCLSSDQWSPESCGSTQSQFKRFCEQSDKKMLLQETRKTQLKAYLERLLQRSPGELKVIRTNELEKFAR